MFCYYFAQRLPYPERNSKVYERYVTGNATVGDLGINQESRILGIHDKGFPLLDVEVCSSPKVSLLRLCFFSSPQTPPSLCSILNPSLGGSEHHLPIHGRWGGQTIYPQKPIH